MAGLNFGARPFVPPGGGDSSAAPAAGSGRGGYGGGYDHGATRGGRGLGGTPSAPPSTAGPSASAQIAQRDDLPDHLLDAIVGRECTLDSRDAFPHEAPGTHYQRLGIDRAASPDDIAAAFARWKAEGLPLAVDRDAGKAAAVDRLMCEAAQVLLTPALRAQYDKTLP